jgi:hypothetical protein
MEKYGWLFVYFLIAVFIGLLVSKYVQESFTLTSCGAITDCATCSNQTSCAWCSNSNACVNADRFGYPVNKECVGNDIVNYPYDCPAGTPGGPSISQVTDNTNSNYQGLIQGLFGNLNTAPQINNDVNIAPLDNLTSYMGGSNPTPGLPIQAYDASGAPIGAYDASGNPIMVIYTENIGGYYDASGNPLQIYDSSGNVLTYPVGGYYDASGNHIGTLPTVNTPSRSNRLSSDYLGSGDSGFYYDANQNPILVSNNNGIFYDTHGNPVNVYDNNGKVVNSKPN